MADAKVEVNFQNSCFDFSILRHSYWQGAEMFTANTVRTFQCTFDAVIQKLLDNLSTKSNPNGIGSELQPIRLTRYKLQISCTIKAENHDIFHHRIGAQTPLLSLFQSFTPEVLYHHPIPTRSYPLIPILSSLFFVLSISFIVIQMSRDSSPP